MPPTPQLATIKEDTEELDVGLTPQPQIRHDHQPHTRFASMSACDKLTMETMMNMDAYLRCMKNRTQSALAMPLSFCPTQIDSTERKFYRRRIIDMTKEMFKSTVRTNADTAVLTAFDAYASACITHFKFIDLADTLQDEYVGLETSKRIADKPPGVDDDGLPDSSDLSKFDKLCFHPSANANGGDVSGSQASQSKIVQIVAPAPSSNSLERMFMVKTESKEKKDSLSVAGGHGGSDDEPVSRTSPLSFLSSLPKIKNVNLMDEQFKMKGIHGNNGGKKKVSSSISSSSSITSSSKLVVPEASESAEAMSFKVANKDEMLVK